MQCPLVPGVCCPLKSCVREKSQNKNENGNIPVEKLIPTAQHISKNDNCTDRYPKLASCSQVVDFAFYLLHSLVPAFFFFVQITNSQQLLSRIKNFLLECFLLCIASDALVGVSFETRKDPEMLCIEIQFLRGSSCYSSVVSWFPYMVCAIML